MAAPGGGRDHTSNDPTGNFGGQGPSQFGSSYYPIDTELTTMSASYNLPSYARQMEEAAASVDKMDHGAMNNMPMDTNGATAASVVDPAMAPPQTPSQSSFMPTASRPSLDASSETPQDPQTGDKRKRSKASRACDECRRKKVKCDAPTEADGTPKTCANCQKAGVNCEFERKPMKRGPSKGYISALAERVQGLEQKQRQSFDGGAGGFAESFSPDEQTGPSFNRAPSFSTPAPTNFNPFPRSEYSRDRIPSIGWAAYSPGPALRSRASGSLAIAPNETFSASITEDDPNLKPHTRDPAKTVPGEIFHSHPAKRQRTQASDDDMHPPAKIDEGFLAKYYNQYHPLYALLPNVTKALSVVSVADVVSQNAFATAIDLLPDLRAQPIVNGNHDSIMNLDPAISSLRKNLASAQFPTYDDLQHYLFAQGQGTALHRTEEENLILVWTLALLAVSSENDVKHLKDSGPLPKSELLHMASFVLERVRTGNDDPSIPVTLEQHTQYRDEVTLAYNCICLMTKYHALSLGLSASVIIPSSSPQYVGDVDARIMPLEASYVASSSNILVILSEILLPSQNAQHLRGLLSPILETNFNVNFSLYDGYMRDNLVPKQLHCLIKLSLALVTPYLPQGAQTATLPYNNPGAHAAVPNAVTTIKILSWADKLTTVLTQDVQTNAATPRYSPLDIHTWSLATLTLCQFVSDISDRRMVDFASMRLDSLRAELQKKSDAFHKGFGLEWFYGGKMEHWADVLLAMIEFVKGRPAAVDEEGADPTILVVPSFSEAMEKGWFNGALFFQKE